MTGSPMTYQLDGRQYAIFAVQNVLYAFALPEDSAKEESATVVRSGASAN
jgi:hypothetical protein